MEQFSHDLTLALEETSRCGETKHRWGMRRRTRSTGNLPCAPQPTEDSSSSPADQLEVNTSQNSPQLSGANNLIQSDSDDRHTLAVAFRSRQTHMAGNFESDSFNENFSPARPNMRRKRKFKRMVVGYEPSLSSSNVTNSSIFPAIVKKRAFNPESLRANLFFCGKRKRSHRDRYFDYESYKQHSSSLPRQRDLFSPKSSSYHDCKSRNRAASFSGVSLNRSIISKIEKISQTSDRNLKLCFQFSTPSSRKTDVDETMDEPSSSFSKQDTAGCSTSLEVVPTSTSTVPQSITPLPFCANTLAASQTSSSSSQPVPQPSCGSEIIQTRRMKSKHASKVSKTKHSRRQQMMQIQFDERMNCANLSDMLSSSSLSSSDSETVDTNESDHEGDDELTDWPGNEGMINFASKHDFKRANKTRAMKPSLPQIKQQDDIQDDDTLMSTDDNVVRKLGGGFEPAEATNVPPASSLSRLKYSPGSSEDLPSLAAVDYGSQSRPLETSPEIAAHAFFQPQDIYTEIREIRAGCRRIRDERPGFSIISSANEQLARFLQNDQQQVLTLFDISATEHDKLYGLSKLYSLAMRVESGCVILTKTSNTMQSVRIDHTKLPKSFADFKRRCYGDSEHVSFEDLPE